MLNLNWTDIAAGAAAAGLTADEFLICNPGALVGAAVDASRSTTAQDGTLVLDGVALDLFSPAAVAAKPGLEAVLAQGKAAPPTRAQIRIGPLEVDFWTKECLYEGRHVRTQMTGYKITAILALHFGRRVPKQRLVEVLWPHSAPENAAENLRSYLFRVRLAFERRIRVEDTNGDGWWLAGVNAG
jgi:DNA-binding response OmpR family regulator